MSETHRYYNCGCCPDEEEWCRTAWTLVLQERKAVMRRTDEGVEEEAAVRAAYHEGFARGWMNCHLGEQAVRGEYKDVEFPSEPPDDGYDEDPRVVGYPH